ncbi:MAG: DUF1559 domain-containing protein [Gemmataceae bacterium]
MVTIRLGCLNNLKQIGLAMHNYHAQMEHFPSGYLYNPPPAAPIAATRRVVDRATDAIFNASYDPGWGWATLLLPYLEQEPLYRQIDLALPCGSPSFDAVRATPLKVYTCPGDTQTGPFWVLARDGTRLGRASTNSYVGIYGGSVLLAINPAEGDGMFYQASKVRIADVTDGLTNTVAVTERALGVRQGAVGRGDDRRHDPDHARRAPLPGLGPAPVGHAAGARRRPGDVPPVLGAVRLLVAPRRPDAIPVRGRGSEDAPDKRHGAGAQGPGHPGRRRGCPG